MRTLVLAAVAILTATPVAWAADEPKAIIEKAVKAHGGADNLNKYLGYRATVKGTVDANGMAAEMSAKMVGQYPNMAKVDGTISIGGQEIKIVQIMNGKDFTMTLNGMKIDLPEEAKEEIEVSSYTSAMAQLTPLVKPEFTLKAAPDADVDGKPAAGVVVSSKDKLDVTLHFDKKTGLLVRLAHKAKTMKGEVNREKTYTDFKEVSGMQIALRHVTKDDGKTTQDFTISNYEVVEKIPASEFKTKDD